MEAQQANHTPHDGHVLELLSAFIDGEIGTDERLCIERHLAVCGPCAGHLAFLRAASRARRTTPNALPSPELFSRIARATYQRPTMGAQVAAFLRPAPTRTALGGVLAAALVAGIFLPRFAAVPSAVPNAPQTPPETLAAVPNMPNSAAPATATTTPRTTPRVSTTPATPDAISAAALANVAQSATRGAALAQSAGLSAIFAASPAPVVSLTAPAPVVRPAAPPMRQVASFAPVSAPPRVRPSAKPTLPVAVKPSASGIARTTPPVRVLPVRKPVQMAMADSSSVSRGGLSARGISEGMTRISRPDALEAGEVTVPTIAAPAPTRSEESRNVLVAAAPVSVGAASETATYVPKKPRYTFGDDVQYQPKSGVILARDDYKSHSIGPKGIVPLVTADVK